MGFFGNLFSKKNCSICGGEIGLLGNRKLEDGNMCKNCAAKLSPWFSDRRSSTVAQIEEQLAYREENKSAVAEFNVTRSLGKNTKVLLDENAGKFIVTSSRQWRESNPDVLDFSQVTGCIVDIDESEREEKRDGPDNKKISYNPPRYTYYYDFFVKINVNHPYFDEIRIKVNSSSVEESYQDRLRYAGVGRPGAVRPGAVRPGMGRPVNQGGVEGLLGAVVNGVVNAAANATASASDGHGIEYHECQTIAYEIKDALTQVREQVREEAVASAAPKAAVTCPWCGATTTPDANGCCEYCGGAVNG